MKDRSTKEKSNIGSMLLQAMVKYKWLRIAVPAAVLLLAIIIGISSSSYSSSRMVQFGLRDVGELTTQAGYFTNVQVIKDSKDLYGWTIPLTTSKYIFSYDGTVKAGIDFEQINVSTNEITKTITINMPEAEIFALEIKPESMKIYDESQSIFTPLNLTDINQSLNALQEEVRLQALNNGILESASDNAKMLIQEMIAQTVNTDVYTIEFV